MEQTIDYANEAIWVCRNRRTGFRTIINGALAQILKKYPKDYRLTGPLCWTPFIDND